MGRGPFWTPEDDKQLRTLAPKHTSKEIAKRLHRTPNAVGLRAKRLGIPLNDFAGFYTQIEIDALRALASTYTASEIAALIGREVGNLRLVAKRMKIQIAKRRNDWSADDTKALRKHAATQTPKEIAKLIGHSAHLIRIRARKLNIKLKRRRPRRAWPDPELRLLRKLAGRMPVAEIAKRLKRTEGAVKIKAIKSGFSLRI